MGDTISSKIDKMIFVSDHIKIDNSGIQIYHENIDTNFIGKYIKDLKFS